MNRLAGYQRIGQLTFTPEDLTTVVGSFSIGPEDDTIWIRVISEQPPTPWPWSYGILGWKTNGGYELGTCKAYSDEAGQTFKLGVGLVPQLQSGQITFEPRGYNLGWIKKGNPWTLTFEAQSGKEYDCPDCEGSLPDLPSFGTRATLGVLADLVSAGVSYAITAGSGVPAPLVYATIRLLK